MDTLQELEFITGPEDAVIMDQAQVPASLAGVWGAWSFVLAFAAMLAAILLSLQPS